MINSYLNSFLRSDEVVVSDIADDRGIHERVIHKQQKIVQYKTKTIIYSLENTCIDKELQNKTQWSKKKSALQLRDWSSSLLGGLALSHQINNWVTRGVIIQINEFTDRGINLKNTYYVPGFNLLNFWNKQGKVFILLLCSSSLATHVILAAAGIPPTTLNMHCVLLATVADMPAHLYTRLTDIKGFKGF